MGLWCLAPLGPFNNISVISWRLFYWWRKPEYPEKTTDLSQATDKLYHIMLYQVHITWAGFELITLVPICTNGISSSNSNYTIRSRPRRPVKSYHQTLQYMQNDLSSCRCRSFKSIQVRESCNNNRRTDGRTLK